MALTSEQIGEIIARTVSEHTRDLYSKLTDVTLAFKRFTTTDNLTPYEDVQIDPIVHSKTNLDLAKSIVPFDGNQYISWRTSVTNCMKIYNLEVGSSNFYTAVNIIRNKVIGRANDVLTSHGTPLNIDAILGRLDLTYDDKRPIHMLQTELTNIRQGRRTLQEYYDEVSKLLTLIINKTIMSYGPRTSETECLTQIARENALRVFITGLNQPTSNLVFSLNPGDLPNALARAQEIEVNQNSRFREQSLFNGNQHFNSNRNFNGNQHYNRNLNYRNILVP